MFINLKRAEQVRVKRAKLSISKTELSEILGVSARTLAKIEKGNYKAHKRIYQAVVDWLLEDL